MAAALALIGRQDEAHSAVKAGLALNPAFTISRARAAWTAMSDDPTFLASIEPGLEGMRQARSPNNDEARAARRLAAILAAHVVGRSRPMGEDKGGHGATPRGFIAVPLGAWSVHTSRDLHNGVSGSPLGTGPPKKSGGANSPASARTFDRQINPRR